MALEAMLKYIFLTHPSWATKAGAKTGLLFVESRREMFNLALI